MYGLWRSDRQIFGANLELCWVAQKGLRYNSPDMTNIWMRVLAIESESDRSVDIYKVKKVDLLIDSYQS